jgi:alpha-galactosidase
VSVLLHRQPPAHLEMLRFWLEFWQTHRDVLLEGTLAPLYPQSGYPTVMASNADKCVIASYSPQIVDLPVPARRACFIVNATRRCEVVVRVPEPATTRDISIFDCRGQKQAVEEIQLDPGIEVLPIPPAGVASLIQP